MDVRCCKEKIKKIYSSGALHITIGTFATKFVAFFGSIVVVRLLDKKEYGLLSYVENIYSYALIFAAFGLSNAILRYIVNSNDLDEKKQYFDYIINHSFFRNIIIMIVLCVISQLVNFPDNYLEAKFLIPLVALLLPFQDLLNDDLYTIRAFFKNKLYAYLAFGSSFALIIGRIFGAALGGINGVLWSRILINMLFAIGGLIFVKNLFFSKANVKKLPHNKICEVNKYAIQYMITNGFWALFMLNDTFLLGILMNDPSGLADYKVAYVLPGNISIFSTAIGIFVAPYFTKNEKNLEWVRNNFRRIYCFSALIVGGVSFILAVFAKPLILFMYGEQYLNVIDLMRILIFAAFVNSGLRYTTANVLAAMGEIKYNMIISGGGIFMQIILDLIFIPKIGVKAVAVSNFVVYTIMAIFLIVVFVKKYYRIKV